MHKKPALTNNNLDTHAVHSFSQQLYLTLITFHYISIDNNNNNFNFISNVMWSCEAV